MVAGAAGVAALVAWGTHFRFRCAQNDAKRARKRAAREESARRVREACRGITEKEAEEITRLSFSELRRAIDSGKYKPSRVLKAYQVQSLKAHGKTNCITEYIVEAEEWARLADESDGSGRPLHGIPVSLKDDVPLQNYDSTWGLINRCEVPNDENCTLVQILREEGAIPFCRTNIPQLLIGFETSNPIFGATCNPHDRTRGSGGSSGGESALIAAGASVLGFGSDLGGSIRNPCAFTGLCGFKPTAERCSKFGHDRFAGVNVLATQMYIASSEGPMARDMDTVVAVMRKLLDGPRIHGSDPLVAPVPLNEAVLDGKRRLRIGFYESDGLVTPVPAVRRALRMAREHLERQGHTLIEWRPPHMSESYDLQIRVTFASGVEGLKQEIRYENVEDCVKYVFTGLYMPEWLRPIAAKVMCRQDPIKAQGMRGMRQQNVREYYELTASVKEVRRTVLRAWRDAELDAVICPAFPFPAPPLKSAHLLMHAILYTMTYNVLNFPAGVVRMTRVTEDDARKMSDYPTTDLYHRRVKQAVEGSVGLPVGVQVVAPWYEDEMCLRVMREVEAAADFHVLDEDVYRRTQAA